MATAYSTDEELEARATEMADKALPAGLPDVVRSAKLPTVRQKILERLLKSRDEMAAKAAAPAPPQPQAGPPKPAPPSTKMRPPPSKKPPVKGSEEVDTTPGCTPKARGSLAKAVDAGKEENLRLLRVDGVELCGDEPWYADSELRQQLRDSVAEGHKEQKILVGPPIVEVARICPPDGRTLGAGAVLRLGGSLLGGYGEGDIAYAYRQLSRALHPDKNPDLTEAPAAFLRLSQASDELRQVLLEQRQILRAFSMAMGGQLTEDMLERPQESLFAEACRLLSAVCGLAGEGWAPPKIETRGVAAFSNSATYNGCHPQVLLHEWFEGRLADVFATFPLRIAYDCAPKRFRAQFLCLLNRVLVIEASRNIGGCVRNSWANIMESFPELGLWRDLRERLQKRVWEAEEPSRNGSRSRSPRRQNTQGGSKWDVADEKSEKKDPEEERAKRHCSWEGSRECDPRKLHPDSGEKASKWACKWRSAIAMILPGGYDSAVPTCDPDVKKLASSLWKDIVGWAEGDRSLALFRDDTQAAMNAGCGSDSAPSAPSWSFIPMSDLFLVVGDGLVGLTAEGIYADNPRGHKRQSLAKCYKAKGGAENTSDASGAAAACEEASGAAESSADAAGSEWGVK